MVGARSLLLVLFSLVACDTLPAAQDGVCGNKVVDSNEDCDTYASPGTYCRPAGTVGECRFACGLQSDQMTYVCPPNMGCGTDGTCRAANGTFTPTQPVTGTFSDLLLGDVDGDHRADVVAVEPNDFQTSFFDGALTVTNVRTPRSALSSVHALLRDINGDGLADLLAAASAGTLVNLGSSSRAFIPTACPSITLPGATDVSLIPLKGLPGNPNVAAFLMGTYMNVSGIALLDKTGKGRPFAFMSQSPANVAGPVVVGHMDEDPAVSPCDDLAFGYVGDVSVAVYTACGPNMQGVVDWNSYVSGMPPKTPTTVSLPSGATLVRGPLMLDVNADGHLDFLVGASRCSGCEEVDVAYGVGDGTFHSNPLTIPKSSGDDTFSVYPLVRSRGRLGVSALPLAMGDLNGDGVPDQVTPSEVLVSSIASGAVTFTVGAEAHGAPWTEAVIADFNHDGIPDVAAGSSLSSNIDFFNGAGNGTFNPYLIQSTPVRHFEVGDFDGDLVNDLAVAELAGPTDALGDSMSVLFGNSVGAPNPPVSMGRFVSITQIAKGNTVDSYGIVSGTDGILTVSIPESMSVDFGGFPASGDRVLRSSLIMATGMSGVAVASGYPLRYAYGHFTNATTAPIELGAIDDQEYPVPTSPTHRSWLLATDGVGRFVASQSNSTVNPLDESALDWSHSAIVAVDLDGSGTDQLLALGPSGTDATHGVAAIARPVPSMTAPPVLTFGSAVPIGALVSRTETDTAGGQTGRLVATDLDGDGRPDVIAVASVAGQTAVVVFWNDHGGQLGAMTAIPSPDGQPVIDFTVLYAGGSGPSVAVLTGGSVSLVGFTQRTPTAATNAFAVPTGGQLIASGDVDGDGVADLVVSNAAGFVVYRGQPVHP